MSNLRPEKEGDLRQMDLAWERVAFLMMACRGQWSETPPEALGLLQAPVYWINQVLLTFVTPVLTLLLS